MTDSRSPEKSYASFLESRFDSFVATRLVGWVPEGVIPNQITIFGALCGLFAALSLYLASFARGWFWLAILALIFNTVADSLDGAVARQKSLTSQKGFLLDHGLDQLVFVALFLAVGCSNYALFPLAVMGAIVSNLHLIVDLFWIHLKNKFPLPYLGPIEIRLTAMVLAMLTFFSADPVVTLGGVAFGWFDVVNVIAIPVSFMEFCVSAISLYGQLDDV